MTGWWPTIWISALMIILNVAVRVSEPWATPVVFVTLVLSAGLIALLTFNVIGRRRK